MKMRATYGLIMASILFAAISIPGLQNAVQPPGQSGSLIPAAQGYVLYSCKWSTSTITWKSINLTSTNLADTKDAIAHWNDAGQNLFIDQTTGTPKLEYYSVTRSDVTWLGLTVSQCLVPNYTLSTIYLNNFKIAGDRIKAVTTSAHETGHAIGLDHTQTSDSDGGGALMWPVISSRISAQLDDVRASKAVYGSKTSTSECTELNVNGDVTYTGTCSGSNPALPMTEAVTSATSTSKAFARTTSSATTLPSNGALVMTAKVKANTVGKFIMGAFTSTDINNSLNRVAAIEMSSDGFWLTRSSTSGFVRSQISSTAPIVGQVYYLVLVIRDDQMSGGYVDKDNGGPTDPPTFLGNPVFTSVQLPWSSSVYYGTGAYTTGTGQPLSSYTVSEYYNLLKSYT